MAQGSVPQSSKLIPGRQLLSFCEPGLCPWWTGTAPQPAGIMGLTKNTSSRGQIHSIVDIYDLFRAPIKVVNNHMRGLQPSVPHSMQKEHKGLLGCHGEKFHSPAGPSLSVQKVWAVEIHEVCTVLEESAKGCIFIMLGSDMHSKLKSESDISSFWVLTSASPSDRPSYFPSHRLCPSTIQLPDAPRLPAHGLY